MIRWPRVPLLYYQMGAAAGSAIQEFSEAFSGLQKFSEAFSRALPKELPALDRRTSLELYLWSFQNSTEEISLSL